MAKYKNKEYRELREMQNLFNDPKYIREVWRNVGNAILRNPATIPCKQYDKNGEETFESKLQSYTYNQLHGDLQAIGAVAGEQGREPTELEMILACQAVRARFDTSAAVFIRDTLGAKPVDESKVEQSVNVFESLTDEELELLALHRTQAASEPTANQALIVEASDAPADTAEQTADTPEETHGNT